MSSSSSSSVFWEPLPPRSYSARSRHRLARQNQQPNTSNDTIPEEPTKQIITSEDTEFCNSKSEIMDELEDRRNAELEFITAAYDANEAWVCNDDDQADSSSSPKIHRRLVLPTAGEDAESSADSHGSILLVLTLPPGYPATDPLLITASLEEKRSNCSTLVLKSAYNALPRLIDSCRQISSSMIGEEAVFAVLNAADDWIRESWPSMCHIPPSRTKEESSVERDRTNSLVMGRRLIYSHHIIGKQKRAAMKELGSHYKLTGFVKIGWPGIIIIEGEEEYCAAFCDIIRPWTWKYLAVRGEQQEIVPKFQDFNSLRRFPPLAEVDDMSLVANHCREVGLEDLFRTSMKVYNNSAEDDGNDDNNQGAPYGALVHVDHMNNPKSYRKWLRKTALETDNMLMIKQCYPNHDFTKRPTIVVAIVGDEQSVPAFLKRWRTSRVDVDSTGKPCLERQMSLVSEGTMDFIYSQNLNWDEANAEESVNVTKEQLVELVGHAGGEEWVNILKMDVLQRHASTKNKE